MVKRTPEENLQGLLERVEEVAHHMEHRRCSTGFAALLLRQRAAEIRQQLGTTRSPRLVARRLDTLEEAR